MALVIKDRVKETSTTTGTGTYTLGGAVTGFQGFSVIGNGNTTYYCATNGTDWEVGIGTYSSGAGTLARTTILASTNAGAAVNWPAGTRTIFSTVPAANVFPAGLASDFRLSLESGVSVSSSDQTSKTTIYLTPHAGNRIALYTGSGWEVLTSAEVSLALGTLSSGVNYDVFAYNNAGTLTLELVAWTNDTTRATALAAQDGVWCKSGALTRRYVGTIRTTSTTTTEDSLAKRFVWNVSNRIERRMLVTESTDSWTYSSASFRSANNSTANRLQYVQGLSLDPVDCHVHAYSGCSGGAANFTPGIGIDSTSADSSQMRGGCSPAVNIGMAADAYYSGFPGIGYHYLQWLEYASNATTTWVGDEGSVIKQTGIRGRIFA